MSHVKIPPVKTTLRIMQDIGADGRNNSLPSDTKSRYLKENDGRIHVEGMDTTRQVQEHRDRTDAMLLQADQTLLKISTDQLFLRTYYTKENKATARTYSNNNSSSRKRPPHSSSPRQPATARRDGSRGRGGGEDRTNGNHPPSSQSARGPRGGADLGLESPRTGGGYGGLGVSLPPINTKTGKPSRWHIRHQTPIPLDTEYDRQLAKATAEEAKHIQQGGRPNKHDNDDGDDDLDSDALANTQQSLGAESLQLTGKIKAPVGEHTAAGGGGYYVKPRGSAAVATFFPWWEVSDLDEASKQQCREMLVNAPETCKVSWADFEYKAGDFINTHPDAEAYEFYVDDEVAQALGGSNFVKDVMEAVGGIETGLSSASAAVMDSGLKGNDLREAAGELDTGLLEILENAASASGAAGSASGSGALTTRGLDEALLFHWDLRRVPKGQRLMNVHRIRSKALQWLQAHFERVDTDLREDFEMI